jgi:hypothetical protein
MKAFLYAYSKISLAEVPQAIPNNSGGTSVLSHRRRHRIGLDDGRPALPMVESGKVCLLQWRIALLMLPTHCVLLYPASFLHNHSTSHKVLFTIVAFIFHANAANGTLSFCNLSHLLTIQSGHLYTEANSRKPGLRLQSGQVYGTCLTHRYCNCNTGVRSFIEFTQY